MPAKVSGYWVSNACHLSRSVIDQPLAANRSRSCCKAGGMNSKPMKRSPLAAMKYARCEFPVCQLKTWDTRTVGFDGGGACCAAFGAEPRQTVAYRLNPPARQPKPYSIKPRFSARGSARCADVGARTAGGAGAYRVRIPPAPPASRLVLFEPSIFGARRRALRDTSRENGPGGAGAYGFESLRLRQLKACSIRTGAFPRAAARVARASRENCPAGAGGVWAFGARTKRYTVDAQILIA